VVGASNIGRRLSRSKARARRNFHGSSVISASDRFAGTTKSYFSRGTCSKRKRHQPCLALTRLVRRRHSDQNQGPVDSVDAFQLRRARAKKLRDPATVLMGFRPRQVGSKGGRRDQAHRPARGRFFARVFKFATGGLRQGGFACKVFLAPRARNAHRSHDRTGIRRAVVPAFRSDSGKVTLEISACVHQELASRMALGQGRWPVSSAGRRT